MLSSLDGVGTDLYVTSGMALSIYMTHVWQELLILFVGPWDLFE
jgi:hypothetical protein